MSQWQLTGDLTLTLVGQEDCKLQSNHRLVTNSGYANDKSRCMLYVFDLINNNRTMQPFPMGEICGKNYIRKLFIMYNICRLMVRMMMSRSEHSR